MIENKKRYIYVVLSLVALMISIVSAFMSSDTKQNEKIVNKKQSSAKSTKDKKKSVKKVKK